ncbi:hypothetical protein [Luteibacter sp. E-22]|uniref:hypothetical protein n=1 Tax=Luteibacter sp. E-22 TaxID=3404050 RepID=UPI003CFBB049
MVSNFLEMPGFLRLLTALALLSLLSALLTIPPAAIDLYGHVIDAKQWWSNGSGCVLAAAHLVWALSAILILKKISCGRALHIFAWLLSGASAFVIAKINDVTPPSIVEHVYPSLIFLSSMSLAIYLYRSERVRKYFSPTQIDGASKRNRQV